jgi:hypothetical protein
MSARIAVCCICNTLRFNVLVLLGASHPVLRVLREILKVGDSVLRTLFDYGLRHNAAKSPEHPAWQVALPNRPEKHVASTRCQMPSSLSGLGSEKILK